MNFWEELKLRLRSETPRFFKRIRAVAVYWGSGFAAAYVLLKTNALDVPDKYESNIVRFLQYAILSAVIVTGGTFLPTLNKTIIKEQVKEDIVEKTKEAVKEKVEDIKPEDIKK